MEVDGESPDYMDEDPRVLMLKEEGTHWEPATIVKATTELKNWALKGAAHPMEDKSVDQDHRAIYSYQKHCFYPH